MNSGVNFSKIGHIGIILCFSVLLVALLGVLLGTTSPVHAATATCPTPTAFISPQSVTSGATVTVSGSNINDGSTNCTPLTGNAVSLGYSMSTDTTCSAPSFIGTSTNTTWPAPGSFTSSFTWPTGVAAGTYIACVEISGSTPGVIVAGSIAVSGSGTTGTATVSADDTSYTVGDDITISGSGFPASTSVSLALQSSDGVTNTSLGTVTTDASGAFMQDYTVPAHPLNSVVIIATYNGQQATSSSFTVKAKASAKPKAKAKPTPVPTYAPPAPVVIAATPTSAPVPTDTPTAVPTDTPTAVPTPTLAPTPVPTPVTVSQTTSSTPFNSSLVAGVAIGMGVLIGLGLLFLVGRFVLRKYVSPAPSPSGASQVQQAGLNANADIPFAQTMAYPPGPSAPEPSTIQQQVSFNCPVAPGSGPFAPEPPIIQQPVPFNGPVPAGNSVFTPTGAAQQPSPPHDWFSPN
jgi:hypothetical protein